MHFKLNDDGESYTLTAFYTEENITALTIPSEYNGKTVTKMDYVYLGNCFELKSLTIPKTIIEIYHDTFIYSELTDVTYLGTMDEWKGVMLNGFGLIDDYKILTVHCSDGDILLEFKPTILID